MALKFDIRKAFDTLDWKFLLSVLSKFGFHQTFVNWVSVILHSAKLSFLVNCSAMGYLSCKRGVRQGDPLSPLPFCIAEEVLSRGLIALVEKGAITPMAGCRGSSTPTHVMYADDIMIFCRGLKWSVDNIMGLFQAYGATSGQVFSPAKSSFFVGE